MIEKIGSVRTDIKDLGTLGPQSQQLRIRYEFLYPYWNSIQALELIDPSGPARYATEEVWQADEDICVRRNIDTTSMRTVVNAQRAEYPDLNPVDREQIQADLLQFFNTTTANIDFV